MVTANLVSKLLQINKDITKLHQYSSDDFLPVNKIFKNYYDQSKKTKNDQPDTVEEGNYKSIIGRIITDLQFHDIIRQKLEHIETINCTLIDELGKVNGDNTYKSGYLSIMPEICQVNEAQLTLIHEEYQSTICKLRIDLEHMEEYIARVSSVSLNLSNSFTQSSNFNKLYNEIVKSLNVISGSSSSDAKSSEGRDVVIKSVAAVYTMQSERKIFDKIFYKNGDLQAAGSECKSNNEDDIEFF
jgi:hypothetical protein